jgi:hypothetical protein
MMTLSLVIVRQHLLGMKTQLLRWHMEFRRLPWPGRIGQAALA